MFCSECETCWHYDYDEEYDSEYEDDYEDDNYEA